MHADRWHQISHIYHAVAQCDGAERAALLDQICRGDRSLRHEIESLLAYEGSGSDLVGGSTGPGVPSLVGRTVGSFEVLEVLGVGGMGHVYRAHDRTLNRDVALKILPDAFASDADRLARFRREAQLLGSLNHPNIAQIYGIEEADGVYGLVLELVEGPTLADRIASGPLTLDDALAIARQLADALHAAHDRGVVHRDLKPVNIKVRADGIVKVLDFGLAKALAPEPGDIPSKDLGRTTRGVILGTIPYMAPEQARGKEADARVDIWAFGVVVYEMVTGRSPFAAETLAETIGAVLYKEPEWDCVPALVQPLLRRCLEKNVDRRSQAIADVKALLAKRPSSPPRRVRPGWVAATAACAAAAVGLSVSYFERAPAPIYPIRFQIPVPARSAFSGYFVVSPDGRHVAFLAADAAGRRTIWVHSLESGTSKPLTRTGDLSSSSIIWSGDSRFIGFVGRGGTLQRIDLEGGAPKTIGRVRRGWGGGAWNAGDVIVMGQAEGGLLRISAQDGSSTPLTQLDPDRQEIGHGGPRFLPDGRHFIYSRASRITGNTALHVGSIDDQPDDEPRPPLLVTDSRPAYAASDDPARGYLLVVNDNVLLAYPFDNRRLALAGEPVPVAGDVGSVPNYFVTIASASASLNGVLAYRPTETTNGVPVWLDREGRELGALTDETLPQVRSPRISPDGKRVALMVAGDLWVYSLDRRPAIRLTFDPSLGAPIWTPDGRRVVYEDRHLNGGRLRSVPSERIAPPETVSPPGHFHPFGWGPDGVLASVLSTTANVSASRTDSSSTISDVDVVTFLPNDRATPRALVKTASFEGGEGVALSPDGRWLAYTSNITGPIEIWVQPYAGSGAPVRVSPNGGTEPRWSRDGRELYYVEGTRMMAVGVQPGPTFEFGPPTPLFEHRYVYMAFPSYDVAPDGRFLVIKPSGPRPGTAPINVVLNWTELLKRPRTVDTSPTELRLSRAVAP